MHSLYRITIILHLRKDKMDKILALSNVVILMFLVCFQLAQCQPVCKPPVCPRGFALHSQSNKCYALINSPMTKDAHIAQCSRLAVGAFIAAPLSPAENNFIQNLILGQNSSEKANCVFIYPDGYKWNYGYFLGGESFERKMCKNFQWRLFGAFRQKMEYTNFHPGEPNCMGNNEYCLNYKDDFTWNDVDCGLKFCSVCELRLL